MILGIPVYKGVDVLDVTGPFEMLNWAGFDVRIAAETPGHIPCRGGISIVAPHASVKSSSIWTVFEFRSGGVLTIARQPTAWAAQARAKISNTVSAGCTRTRNSRNGR